MSVKKHFLINFSELEERLDPFFYLPEFQLPKSTHPVKTINSVSYSVSHPPEYKRDYSPEGIQLIRAQNVRPTGLNLADNPVYFSEDNLKNKRKLFPKSGDVLVVRSGVNAGDTCSIEYDIDKAIIGADNLLIKPNDSVISKFIQVYFFTSLGSSQMSRYITGATNKHINPTNLRKIKIFTPSKNIQEKVIKIFEVAIEQKKQKDKEAKSLLSSIDDYLLSELDIKTPKYENTLENRIFTTNYSSISSNRFDPKAYSTFYQNLYRAINNSAISKLPLKNFVISIKSGEWGVSEVSVIDKSKYENCLVIRSTEFDNNYNLKLDNSRTKYRLIKKDKLISLEMLVDDLLVEKSGGSPDQPVGRVALLTDEILSKGQLCFSNFLTKIRINPTELLPKYLFYYLKTMHSIRLTEVMQSQTHGIRNLIWREFINIPVVKPSLKIQLSLINKIDELKSKAYECEKDSIILIDNAKKEAEKIILGETI